MKLPTLSRIWNVLRNAVVAGCCLAIVVALLLPVRLAASLGLIRAAP